MRLIINDKDITELTGEVEEYRGEILLSLSFLEKLKDSGVEISKTASEFKIEFKPEAILKILSPKNPFPANLGIKIETDENKQLKAKAELSFGDLGTASIDHTGKIEAGFNLKF